MNSYLASKKASLRVADLRRRVRSTHHSGRCTECTLHVQDLQLLRRQSARAVPTLDRRLESDSFSSPSTLPRTHQRLPRETLGAFMNSYLASKKASLRVANPRRRVRSTHHFGRCTECTLHVQDLQLLRRQSARAVPTLDWRLESDSFGSPSPSPRTHQRLPGSSWVHS